MAHSLAAQIDDFYENGLINILRALPGNLPDEQRLAIESVVYTSFGLYRSYRSIESALSCNTTDEGTFTLDVGIIHDIFAGLWSLFDSAYAIDKLHKLSPVSGFLVFSPETSELISQASNMRNFMDHLDKQFGNAVKASDWFPLFGWASFQFIPYARNPSLPHNLLYLINLSSTHFRGTLNLNAFDHSSASVLGEIDNVTLHMKKGDSCNLTRLMAAISLDMNNYAIGIMTYLINILQGHKYGSSGLMVPFSQATLRADLHDQSVSLLDIKRELDHNKIRFEVEPS